METKNNPALEHDIKEQENIIDLAARLLKQTGSEVYLTQIQVAIRHINKILFDDERTRY
jgi:hypothetical protein